jgi:predicted transcriptional regulator
MALGELEADVLGAVHKLGKASTREVMHEVGAQRQLAYTTVSTVLDRLYRKGLIRRSHIVGRGGGKYEYLPPSLDNVRSTIVNKALKRLISAFGPSIVPTIYDSLERISTEEVADLKKKLAKAQT